MTSIVEVRRFPDGTPACSLTFLLSRAPAPHERLTDLVISATVAVEFHSSIPDLVRFSLALDGRDGEAVATAPFPSAALACTFEGGEAASLLTAVAQDAGGPKLTLTAEYADGRRAQTRHSLVELLRPVLSPNPGAVVKLATANGGEITEVLPSRPVRTRGEKHPVMIQAGDSVVPLGLIVSPTVPITNLRYEVNLGLKLTFFNNDGPILDGSPLLSDRSSAARWYLPEVSLEVPEPGQPPDGSPFRFDVVPAGHQSDGSPGLEATVVLTLRVGPSAATLEAWQAAGKPAMQPVPCEARVGLRLPFRDENGKGQVEVIPATTTTIDGTLGRDGSTITATFALKDTWARLAYGALSTPGFQPTAPAVEVTLAHSGWRTSLRRTKGDFLAGRKTMAIRKLGDVRLTLPRTQTLALAKSGVTIQAPLMLAEESLMALAKERYEWVAATDVSSVEAVLPCSEHGQLYRQFGNDEWRELGCQPALTLGQAEYRTWQPESVDSVRGVRVFRSLTQPGRFLVVPENHAVGRYGPDETERAYEPSLLLTSTIDGGEPPDVRCVVAAALEPEWTGADEQLLASELTARVGRPVDLVSPWEAGLTPEIRFAAPQNMSVECVPTDTGFTTMVTTDVAGLLTLKVLLQHSGLIGSARYRLPGGVEAISTIRLDLSRVTGPTTGPVEIALEGGVLALTNRLPRRVSVNRVVAGGAVVLEPKVILPPHGTTELSLPDTGASSVALDCSAEPGAESLDETRSYIEDLHLGFTFVATGDLDSVAGLEVTAELLGAQCEPITLTRTARQAERSFVLPLTTYAADPVLTFTVASVATDGTRTAAPTVEWPVRSRGALIPIQNP